MHDDPARAWVAWDGEAFSVHIEGGPGGYVQGPSAVPLETALEWARSRAHEIVVRPADNAPYYSAGPTPVAEFEPFETFAPDTLPPPARQVFAAVRPGRPQPKPGGWFSVGEVEYVDGP